MGFKKLLFIGFGAALLAGLIFSFTTPTDSEISKKLVPTSEAGNAFAVVELFTSQGCSSCPPADRVLSEIVDHAKANNLKIYGLSFHVDYWNNLGWEDPYSDARFSQRQRAYVTRHRSTAYTPQMIVNGTSIFVGSNEEKATENIQNALTKAQQFSSLEVLGKLSEDKKTITVDYKTTGALNGHDLHVALVERDLEDAVLRGENRDRKLHHDNVVREFQSKGLQVENGSMTLDVPVGMKLENASVIGFVQKEAAGEVIAVDEWVVD